MPHMPKPWGRGAGALEQLIIDEELRAAGIHVPGLAIGAWVVPALIQYGTPEQQQRFLPPRCAADYLWCQLFSEPGAGLRPGRADHQGRARRRRLEDHRAEDLDLAGAAGAWAICIARTDPAQPRARRDQLLPGGHALAGRRGRPLREIGGDSFFNQVFLDEVFVPDDCLVGEVNKGWRIARTTLANERVSLSRTWTFGCGVPELLEDGQGGRRRAARPRWASWSRPGTRSTCSRCGLTLKQLSGTEPGATGSVRKLLEHAARAAGRRAVLGDVRPAGGALGGGAGAAGAAAGAPPDGAHWARQVLITRALTIGGGTTDIQLNIIGERILGLPRDPEPPEAAPAGKVGAASA